MSRIHQILFAGGLVIGFMFMLPQWLNSTSAESEINPGGTLNYVLDWNWDEATALADNTGWQTVNDLDYTITVIDGYLISYSIELIACDNNFTNDPLGTLYETLMPTSAAAGHGEESDPSRLAVPVVESLSNPQSFATDTLELTGTSYCWGHYLIGSSAASENYDADNTEASLYIAGIYQPADSAEAIPFEIEADIAWGNIVELSDAGSAIELVTAGENVTLNVQRDLGSMFDGVDFEEMDASEQARSMLRNLTQTATISVSE